MNKRIPVAVLGATGAVGQRFVSLLADHPWFEVVALTGSERSAGQHYGEVVQWILPEEIPSKVGPLLVRSSEEDPGDVPLVFSALPSSVAHEVEPRLAKEGYVVCSNASALRMEPDVPMLIPEVNPEHLALIDLQRTKRNGNGFVVTSPNCATTGIAIPLKALHDAFGLEKVHAVTLQAVSGAGYPGIAVLDIHDNVIPFIKGEEEKVEQEPRKLLGKIVNDQLQMASFTVSAQVHRVPVSDGHLAALSIGFSRKASLEEARSVLTGFRAPETVRSLPSAPEKPLILREEIDRPQPRLDRTAQDGMAVVLGRLQPCPVLDLKLVSLVHNTLRGAASGSILNAELIVAQGYLGESD
ncbi:MAG: aspartate-semialdehyde dehydrogenase [Anaerolineales bacterium]|nr:aspartate-semialdehyde dehydrogenase [Anaerolineales bacterium]